MLAPEIPGRPKYVLFSYQSVSPVEVSEARINHTGTSINQDDWLRRNIVRRKCALVADPQLILGQVVADHFTPASFVVSSFHSVQWLSRPCFLTLSTRLSSYCHWYSLQYYISRPVYSLWCSVSSSLVCSLIHDNLVLSLHVMCDIILSIPP